MSAVRHARLNVAAVAELLQVECRSHGCVGREATMATCGPSRDIGAVLAGHRLWKLRHAVHFLGGGMYVSFSDP